MRLQPRFAALLWAGSLLAVVTVACTPDVKPPPSGARLVESKPANPAAQQQASALQVVQPAGSEPAQRAAASASAEPTTPVPVVQVPAASSPVAQVASPAPSVGNQRSTAEAMFLVSNTLGRGIALRSSPVARDPGKSWPDGTRMKGLGAEQDAYGWTWRFVRDPEGKTGWAPSNYLIQDESAPAPAMNGGLQLPSAPPTLILVPTKGVVAPTPTAGPPTPAVSPVPAPQNGPPLQNASAPQSDGLVNTLRSMPAGQSGSGLPTGLPSMFGGR